jgi:hypothetical protein
VRNQNKKIPARSRERIPVEEKLALSRLLARLLLSTATLLAALSGALLTALLAWLLLSATLLARLLLSATLLAGTMLAATLALLARLLLTRVHNGSFVDPPTHNETVPSKVPWILDGKRTQPHRNLSSEMTVA